MDTITQRIAALSARIAATNAKMEAYQQLARQWGLSIPERTNKKAQ